MKFHLTSLLLLLTSLAYGQSTNTTATLSVNRVKAIINNDGRLFSDGAGGFVAPFSPGPAERTLMRGSGLIIAAQAPNDVFKVSAATPITTDFTPGILNENGASTGQLAGKIWRVTRTDIEAHIADFEADGDIDTPLPGVFGWPARGNAFFSANNPGFELPNSFNGYAAFFDSNGDGVYNPQEGDYPRVEIRECGVDATPDEILWYVFNDAGAHPATGSTGLGMEIQATVFAYNCDAGSPVGNAVFVIYKLIYRGSETFNEAHFGMMNEFSIGGNNDDFVGCDTSRFISYAYNGDLNDENGFGTGAPAMSVETMRGPLVVVTLPDGTVDVVEKGFAHAVPFDPAAVTGPAQFANMLNGLSADGNTLANNGRPFADTPLNANGVSELSQNNLPGRRGTIMSYGSFQLNPGAVNEMVYAYSYAQGAGLSAFENTGLIAPASNWLQSLFDNCFTTIPGGNLCDAMVDVPTTPKPDIHLSVVPNPALDAFTVSCDAAKIKAVVMTDLQGRTVKTNVSELPAAQIRVDLNGLPAGMYFVKTALDNGLSSLTKIVKAE